MATGPSEGVNDLDLLERRRWGAGIKVYTRKNKGQINSNSSVATTISLTTATTSEPGAVSVNDEVNKRTGTGNGVPYGEAQEGCKKDLAVEYGNLRQPDCPQQVAPSELPSENEEVGGGGVPVLSSKGYSVESKEVIVPSKNGDGEAVGLEIEYDKSGQEVGDSRGENAARECKELFMDGKEAVVPSVIDSRVEREEGSGMLQPIREVVKHDKLGPDVADSHGDKANQNRIDLLVAGKEALLSSRNDYQSQHDDGPSRGETIRPSSNDMLPENTAGGGALEQASSGETVRICDEESPESREVVVPPHSSVSDIADANGVVRQNKPQLDMEQLPSVMIRVDDKLRINVSGARSSNEIRGVKRKLETELDQVRSLFKKLQAKELQVTASNCITNNGIISNVETINTNNVNRADSTHGDASGNFNAYIQPEYALNDVVERTLTRVSSEVGSVLHRSNKLFNRSLSVSMVDNDHGVGEFVEREKRTPKANQLYRNSEFLLGKDRLPAESNKKLKSNGAGRKYAGEIERHFGVASLKNKERAFKSCSTLLQRLMKHNFGWVFNEPVDVKKLGLHDYHDIIKHPMDLGTIKARLSLNYYKSPMEYADDVRLVFNNAMTYNPKGHDVNVMAETLLRMFEERWMVIETDYNVNWRYQMYQDAGLPAPMSRFPATQFHTPAQVPAPVHAPAHVPAPAYASAPPVPQRRTLESSQLMTMNTTPTLKPFNHVARTPAPKKPKARDINKRNMTYDEKQKLSTNLQNLPSEKLDAIVHIIKRRTSALSQNNDEIEVDIDNVDTETLWELDRFITNYKKSLSKNKRKAELALQIQAEAVQATAMMNTLPGTVDMQKETRIGENNDPPPIEAERQGDHDSRSSSSSSSSSSSGSSSSDSDSDSSSSCGSDSKRSPRT